MSLIAKSNLADYAKTGCGVACAIEGLDIVDLEAFWRIPMQNYSDTK